jgi:ABC-2 type transport system permease protein
MPAPKITMRKAVPTSAKLRRMGSRNSMAPVLRTAMQTSPSTHFVSFTQAILFGGAGIEVVWPQFLAVAVIGGLFFGAAVLRFRTVTSQLI